MTGRDGDRPGTAWNAGLDAFAREAGPRLLRVAHALTGNRPDAEDLVQETLVRVGLAWPRLSAAGDPGPYARRTLVNLFLNERRRRGYESRLVARLGGDQGADDVHPGLALDQARALLAVLAPKQRAAVALRYVLDLDDAAIGAALGCSASTVRSQIARGLDRLRAAADTDPDLAPGPTHREGDRR